jgi:alpha-methylacyl-CoA racemase
MEEMVPKVNLICESFRPGVMETMNLGPQHVHAINPDIIYVRISGYGRQGLDHQKVGRDLNYLASAGLLAKFRRS